MLYNYISVENNIRSKNLYSYIKQKLEIAKRN